MNQQEIRIFFALLRSAIGGANLTEEEIDNYSPDFSDTLLKASESHDLTHLLAYALKENRLAVKENEEIDGLIFKAVYRYQRLKYDYDRICEIFESARIPFVSLKGSVIRRYYPEPWMRTSCDIDILVRIEDAEKAKSVLIDEYGCTYHNRTACDISLFTPANTHIELHYDLLEDGIANKSSEVLRKVWQMSFLREGGSYSYEMADEMSYFYHIAHMAKHFEHGGCGIRPFIDLFLLDAAEGADAQKREALLAEGELLTFANSVRKLSRIWFKNEDCDFISEEIEEYILSGGVYGNNSNRIMIQQSKNGGKFRYAMSKIFLPYDRIKYHYPILKKHKWLTPFMEVRRWFKLIFRGGARRSAMELKANASVTKQQAERAALLLKEIGL